jgi:hypothetical protein
MKHILLLILSVVGLGACGTPRYVGNEDSPFYKVPIGSRLILEQDLEFPPERLTIYLQDGKIFPSFSGVQQYRAHCLFEVRHKRDAAQTVKADTFEVQKTTQIEETSRFGPPVRAAGEWQFAAGNPAFWVYLTRLDLRSERQPEVMRLTCQRWETLAGQQRHLSINELRKALAPFFRLETPAVEPAPK